MVTQQILVLFFLVRIRVAQQINEEFDVSDSFFIYILYIVNAILLILTLYFLVFKLLTVCVFWQLYTILYKIYTFKKRFYHYFCLKNI